MGGGGPSKTTTTQQTLMDPTVRQLIQLGVDQTQTGLAKAPIAGFQDPMIEPTVGPDPATLDALSYFQSLAGGGATPGILDAFNRLQLPLIQQQAMQAGLGRSGALLDAEAIGQASAIMPALQLQTQGAGAMASIGDYLRNIAQTAASAPYADFLRRQGITEELLSGATGLIPSTFGQKGTQDVKNAGIWGWLLGPATPGK